MRKLIHHFLSPKDSINRWKYWASHLFLFLCCVCLVFGMPHISETADVKYADALTALGMLLLIYSSLCLHCKRLEDIQQAGRSYLKFREFLKPITFRPDLGCLWFVLRSFYFMFCVVILFSFPYYIIYVCAFRAGQK